MSDLRRYQEEYGPEAGQVDDALARIRAVTITEANLEWAGNLLKDAKFRAKELEDKRKEITGPILVAKAGVDGLFKPLIGRYEQAEAILKDKIAAYTRAVEDQRRATMAASSAEYQAGGTPTAMIQEPVKIQGISIRQVWDYEITDENAIPRDFCSPDPKKIRAWMALGGNAPAAVPGVRFFQRDQVAARAGKV